MTKQVHTLELDVVREAVETSELTAEFLSKVKEYGLKTELIEAEGEAGGNPVYLFKGSYEDLHRYFVEVHFQHDSPEDREAAEEHWSEYPAVLA